MSAKLPLFTIYNNPTDYPGKHVVRRFDVGQVLADEGELPSELVGVFDTYSEARMPIPPGLFCVGRNPADEPQIVESWL